MTATIALVDDDRNILTSVSMALEAEGYKVRTYSDGSEALRGLTSQPADLAVLDIKMPRMDGMELLQRLRKQSAIPVIFLTSKDDEIDELLGLRMGADDYIKKPFSQKLLIERIRALIRRVEAAAGGGEAERLVQLVVLAGEEDHRDLALLAQAAEQLQPVHLGHLDVEHRQFGRVLDQRLERAFAVRIDARQEPFGLERDRDRGQDVPVVVDEGDRGGHGAGRRAKPRSAQSPPAAGV